MLFDGHHAGHVTNRAEHRTFFLPGMNATPEFDGAVLDLNPQSIGLTIGSRFERFFNLVTKFFHINAAGNDRDLIDNADYSGEPQYRLLCVFPFTPNVNVPSVLGVR